MIKKPAITSKIIAFIVLSSVFALFNISSAQRKEGCAWLKIPVAAREAALAGSGTAAATGPQGLSYNPAITARLSRFSAQVGYTKWLLDTQMQSLFISRELRPFSLGIGLAIFSGGKVEYREEIPTEEPVATFSPLDLTAYLNIARSLASWVDAGISVRFFYSKLLNSELSGWGGDIGARFHPLNNLQLGVAVTDFGQTLFYEQEVFWLPSRLRTGIGYTVPFGKNTLLVVTDASWFFYSKKFALQSGIEFTLGKFLSFRAGYDPFNTVNHFNFGLGLTTSKLRLDYAFSPLGLNIGTAHRLGIGFGY